MYQQPSTLVCSNNEALRAAVIRGDANTVQALLATTDVDINATDNNARTALTLATYQGSIETILALLANPSLSINAIDECSRTTLILAAYRGCTNIVSALLTKADIDVNATDAFGRSALIWAVCNNHISITRQLLDTPSIKVNIGDRDSMTPLMHAQNRHNPVIIAALEQAVLRETLMEAYRLHFGLNDAQTWAATMPEILALHDQWLADQDVMLFLMGFITPLTHKEARVLQPFLKTAYAAHVILSEGTSASLEKALALILLKKTEAATPRPCNTAPLFLATMVRASSQIRPTCMNPLFSHRRTE